MAVIKTQRKIAARPRKAVAKKIKPKKGSLEAIDQFIKIVRKHNIDFSFIKE